MKRTRCIVVMARIIGDEEAPWTKAVGRRYSSCSWVATKKRGHVSDRSSSGMGAAGDTRGTSSALHSVARVHAGLLSLETPSFRPVVRPESGLRVTVEGTYRPHGAAAVLLMLKRKRGGIYKLLLRSWIFVCDKQAGCVPGLRTCRGRQ